ncbi:MAG: hypothetical protein KC481_02325 [Acidimicrobiaceae bacterium]|nr:hypothetical protein [Acidimicrobiaceae bacterium]
MAEKVVGGWRSILIRAVIIRKTARCESLSVEVATSSAMTLLNQVIDAVGAITALGASASSYSATPNQ